MVLEVGRRRAAGGSGARKLTPAHSRRGTKPRDETIYRRLFDAIIERDLSPATKLTEDQLASAFEVSRTRIRKVLLRLAHENSVTLQPNRGASVARPTVKEARDVFAVRRILECGMLQAMPHPLPREAVQRLRSFVAEEHAAHERRDRRQMIKLSGEFHLELARLTGNDALSEVLRALISRTALVIAVYEKPGMSGCHDDDHDELIGHLARGDTKAAIQLMDRHLDRIEGSLELADSAGGATNLGEVLAGLASRSGK